MKIIMMILTTMIVALLTACNDYSPITYDRVSDKWIDAYSLKQGSNCIIVDNKDYILEVESAASSGLSLYYVDKDTYDAYDLYQKIDVSGLSHMDLNNEILTN